MDKQITFSEMEVSLLNQMNGQLEENVKNFMTPIGETLRTYSSDLDALMSEIYQEVFKESDPSTELLERYLSKLTAILYFVGERLETLNTYVYMSSAKQKETYNTAYLENRIKTADKSNKMTVAELQAISDEASKYESVLNAIYRRAYSVLKYKIEAAQEMIRTISKLLSKRMQDESMTNTKFVTVGSKKPLLEDERVF